MGNWQSSQDRLPTIGYFRLSFNAETPLLEGLNENILNFDWWHGRGSLKTHNNRDQQSFLVG